jgi:hypothetical protein
MIAIAIGVGMITIKKGKKKKKDLSPKFLMIIVPVNGYD